MLDYQKQVFKTLADIMAAASVDPEPSVRRVLLVVLHQLERVQPDGGMAYYDDETKAAAQAALGRPLHVFTAPRRRSRRERRSRCGVPARPTPRLRGRADHARPRLSCGGEVRGAVSLRREPPDPGRGASASAGRLNRFVNLPVEWEQKSTSGLDRLKIEALDFGAWSPGLEPDQGGRLVRARAGLAQRLAAPHAAGVPARLSLGKECSAALGEGVAAANLWAFDHVCLFGTRTPPVLEHSSARRQG